MVPAQQRFQLVDATLQEPVPHDEVFLVFGGESHDRVGVAGRHEAHLRQLRAWRDISLRSAADGGSNHQKAGHGDRTGGATTGASHRTWTTRALAETQSGERVWARAWRCEESVGTEFSVRLAEIAPVLDAVVEGDADIEVDELAPLDGAGPRSLSFLSNPKYLPQLAGTGAAAVILGPDVEGPGCAVLRVPDAYMAFAKALEIFDRPIVPPTGIDPRAHVAASARIGPEARIAAGVHVGEDVTIGARVTLHPGVVLYPHVTIADDFTAHANVVVRERVRIGNRVTLAAGVALGGEGFGYIPLPGGGVQNIRQIGTVEIEDDVEIGANATIDRAAIGVTRIEAGAKIDNLVMIAHGCRIGPEALIAAQTGLAGSTTVGARAQLGGQVGSAGHLTIGPDARVAAQSGIPADVAEGTVVGGYPAMDVGLWRRVSAAVHKLPELLRRVRRLEKALERD